MTSRKFRTIKRKKTKPSLKKTVKLMVNRAISHSSEQKYFDYAANINIYNQWAWAQIVSPLQGTSDNGKRIGDTIMPTHMEIGLTITGSASASLISRLVIFRVKTGTSNNAYMAIGSGAVNDYAVVSPYSHDRRGAIEVLMDRKFVTGTNGNNITSMFKTLKLAKKKIQFIGDSTTYELGGLYIALCSSHATYPSTFLYNIRTFYTDS